MSELDDAARPGPKVEGSYVEREVRRRKRLLTFYLALLAVPVALGIVVLVFGRSDRQMVTDELKTQAPPLVQREVREQIRPTVKDEVLNQVSPALGQIDELKTRQQKATETLRQENEALRSEVRGELSKLNAQGINEKLNRLEVINERLNKLERQNFEGRLQLLERRINQSIRVEPIPRPTASPQ